MWTRYQRVRLNRGEIMNIDQSFSELEKIIARMEGNNQSIEEALVDYDNGMKLVKQLREELVNIEKKIQIINAETGEVSEE